MKARPTVPPQAGRAPPRAVAAALLSVAAVLAILITVPSAPPRFPPLPDFSTYRQTDQMKAAFIDYLTPIVEYQNGLILADRTRLTRIAGDVAKGRDVLWFDMSWLRRLARRYDVAWHGDDLASVSEELLRRVDIIPLSLVIVQAAKESSWGQSRFALEGNNLFGHWCYDDECGLVPEQRPEGDIHRVRAFTSVSEAVRSYLRNLNTHERYAALRRIRERLRLAGRPISGLALADGLLFYSERRADYVEEVKAMIRQYLSFQNARPE